MQLEVMAATHSARTLYPISEKSFFFYMNMNSFKYCGNLHYLESQESEIWNKSEEVDLQENGLEYVFYLK